MAVVIAMIAFVIVPLLGSLVQAHHTNKEARDNTELALVSQSFNTLLENMKPYRLRAILADPANQPGGTAPGFVHYFSSGGRWLGTTASPDTWYRCTIHQSNGPQDRLQTSLIVTIAYPAPGYKVKASYPLSVFHYGTTTPIP